MKKEISELIKSTNELARDTFKNKDKMKKFLDILAKVYNISSNNILLLMKQREKINKILTEEDIEMKNIQVKEGEVPLKIIKRTKDNEYTIKRVYDITQTNILSKDNYMPTKSYIERTIKGMLENNNISFYSNASLLENIQRFVTEISNKTREENPSNFDIDNYAKQKMVEVQASVYAICKIFNIEVNDNELKNVCTWGIDKDTKVLKESLKYIQRYTNYFMKEFRIQVNIDEIEEEFQEEIE